MKPAIKPEKRASTGRQRRPGGRSQRVWEAVAAATESILIEKGLDDIGVVEIARLAGVNPTTIYRRWGDRDTLLMEVLMTHAEAALPLPDTGTLRGDLRAYLGEAASLLQSSFGSALLQLGALALRRPQLQVQRKAYWEARLKTFDELIARAIKRREIAPGLDSGRLLEALGGPLYARLLFTGDAIDSALIDATIERALCGLAGARVRQRRRKPEPTPKRRQRRSGRA